MAVLRFIHRGPLWHLQSQQAFASREDQSTLPSLCSLSLFSKHSTTSQASEGKRFSSRFCHLFFFFFLQHLRRSSSNCVRETSLPCEEERGVLEQSGDFSSEPSVSQSSLALSDDARSLS